MSGSFLSLVPPLIVLSCALLTRRVLLSLSLGIISASLIIAQGNPLLAGYLSISQIITQLCESEHLFTFGFLFTLGIFIQLLTHTGGLHSYTRVLQKFITTKKSAELSSLFLSLSFFMDDYLNSLTVGAIMRPLTDKLHIPRAKLAFLVDSMSAPLCVLIPATSWVATILVQIESSGISKDLANSPLIIASPFSAYLGALAFTAYPLFIIISAYIIVLWQLSFGTMKCHETIAQASGNLFGGFICHTDEHSTDASTTSLADFIIPIGSFICIAIASLTTLPIFPALFTAGSTSLVLSITYFTLRQKITSQSLAFVCYEGIKLMKNSTLLLLLAWTLSTFLKNDLQTGPYLASLLLHTMPLSLLPVVIFITSTIISAATGSAWGTLAVIMPLAIPTAVSYAALKGATLTVIPTIVYPSIAAVLSGAVAGGHFSPITDSTLMASTSTGARHFDHVITQISYSLPALIGSLCSFILSGILIIHYTPWIAALFSFLLGSMITIFLLFLRSAYSIQWKIL